MVCMILLLVVVSFFMWFMHDLALCLFHCWPHLLCLYVVGS